MDFYGLQDNLNQSNSKVGTSRSVSIEDRYILQDQLGKGAYGIVWKGKKRLGNSNELYAIKQINMRHAGDKGMKDVIGEVETMSLLNHHNIVRLEETFRDETSLWIVMEYLPGGELQQVLKEKCLSEQMTKIIVTQLLDALEYIHDRGIVHRDLKPANCLLSEADCTVKISDFGFAVLAGSDQCLTTYCGTVAFMAPEILLDKNYGKPVDMWALGIMTYMMFVGNFPFSGDNAHQLAQTIVKSKDIIESDEALKDTPLLKDFISGLLTQDPNRRLTAKDALKHRWVKAGAKSSTSADTLSPQKGKKNSVSNAAAKKAYHRFRAACIAIIAMHRLIFWNKYRHLVKIESERILVLKDLHYMLTGEFKPKTAALDCSEMFSNKPEALEILFCMLDATKTVEHVDLSKNNIESLSLVQSLIKVLARHSSITHVNMSHNPIPALAGRGILRLARNPTCRLRSILLDHTDIPNDIVQQINNALKDKVFSAVPEVISVERERTIPEKSTGSTVVIESNNNSTSGPLELPLAQLRSQSTGNSHPSPHSSHNNSSASSRKSRKRSTRLPPLPQAALSKRFMQKVE